MRSSSTNAASEAAVETLTIGLGREVACEGVRVACLAPGIATVVDVSGGR
jgi:NAD(P)-dependent dehydrogenase (short-subunit alcohol dehydrogenase family)